MSREGWLVIFAIYHDLLMVMDQCICLGEFALHPLGCGVQYHFHIRLPLSGSLFLPVIIIIENCLFAHVKA